MKIFGGFEVQRVTNPIDGLEFKAWKSRIGTGYHASYGLPGDLATVSIPGSGGFTSMEEAMEACNAEAVKLRRERENASPRLTGAAQ